VNKYKFGSKVLWTDEEKKRLSFAVYYYLKVHPESSKLNAIKAVQSLVLPPSRVREFTSYTTVSAWLDPELDSLYSSDVKLNVDLELTKVPFEKIISELINRFDERVLNIIETKIIDKLNSLENMILNIKINSEEKPQPIEIISSSKPKPKIKKKKMLIVGLLHSQFNEIKLEYNEYFDIKGWSDDSSIPKLKSMLTYIDHIFVMVSFISHSTDNIVAQSGKNYTRISGGLSALKDELDKHI